MRAAVTDRVGDPGELHLASVADSALRHGQVRIRVAAAAVGITDAITRAGDLISPADARFPMVRGWDAAGAVEELAPGAGAFREGERVAAFSADDHSGRHLRHPGAAEGVADIGLAYRSGW